MIYMTTTRHNLDPITARYVKDARIAGITIERSLGQTFVTVPSAAHDEFVAATLRASESIRARRVAR